MLHPVTFRTFVVAACGWLLAYDAAALSLGRARGAILVGRPLDVAIPATLDTPGEAPCASADVFYGETRIGGAPAVRWEPGSGTGQGVLRVTSAIPVDEPMITVYLRVGCGAQTSTRRYVMLSELPPDNEAASVQGRTAVRPPVMAAAPATSRAEAPAVATPAREGRATAPRSTSPRRPDAVPSPAPRARREAAQASPPAAGQARLKLEPLDLSIDRDPTLRLSSDLSTQLLTDPPRRAAAAALWQVLQRGPDASMEEALRLQSAERELQSLRDVTRQDAAAVSQLRAQVEEQGSRRNAAPLAVGLSLLLAGLLGWLAWRWQRARQIARVGQWFEDNRSVQGPLPDAQPATPNQAAVAVPAGRPSKVATAAAGAAALAAAAKGKAKPAVPAPVPAGVANPGPQSSWSTPAEFAPSRGASVRMVGVQEVIDVHDKADFFLSIGEPEQAVAVLESHVHDQAETSALAWMDLLDLYHSLGKRVEYERLRGEFRQRFAAQVPDFEHFDQPTASLENYSRALSRIVALWPSQRVLDVIEESIFRKPGVAGAEPFSLEAYRELVLLYHVAKDVSPEQVDTSRAGALTSFPDTSLQPLNLLDRPEPTVADRERLLIPPASRRLGVDIDLDAEAAPESVRPKLPPLDFDISGADTLEPNLKRG